MPLPVAVELAMVARFYERFGDHAVNLAKRVAALAASAGRPPDRLDRRRLERPGDDAVRPDAEAHQVPRRSGRR